MESAFARRQENAMSIAEKIPSPSPAQAEAPLSGPASEAGKRVSEALYWNAYYEYSDISYEWNDGVLEEKPVSDYLSFLVYLWFVSLLEQFLTVHPIGKMVGLEFGFRLALPEKVAIRKPDLGVLSAKNPVDLDLYDRSFAGIFDLCIEVLSDSERSEIERDTQVKFLEYEQAGVREYYILDRKGTHTAFYRRRADGRYAPIVPETEPERNLIRSEVLPGFQFRIDDLYRRPSLKEMAEDPVYRGFVLPFYQESRQRADAEKARADQEAARADAEAARAARLAEKLKQLGFPEE
jgi:Uma2 family endonuclease